jgi:uncharacterized protein (DUF885 family)
MKRCTLALLGGAALLASANLVQGANDEDRRLNAFFQQYLDEEFRQRPLDATRAGDHRFDHLLDDLSPQARAGWVKRYRLTLEALPQRVSYEKLSRDGQIDYEILEHNLKAAIWQNVYTNPYEDDPRIYNDYINDSTFLLLTQSTAPKALNLKNCVERMRQIPKIVAAARQSLKNPPRVYAETAIRQNRGAIAYYESGIFEIAGETPGLSELTAATKPAVAALKEHQQFLEKELLPRATGDWRLGKERFVKKLDFDLNAGISAAQVLLDAEAEAVRVEGDMYVIARQLWATTFPKKPLPPDDAAGRRATIQQVLAAHNREHGRVEDLVSDVRATVARIKTFIKEHDILRLPEPDRCQIMEMPEFQRGNTVAYLNPAPPLDPKAASVYAVSPPPRDWDTRRVQTFMEEYNRSMMQILTIHEGYPGHYVQLEYGNRNPSHIRNVLWSGVFAEGWAVYTEQMMLDQGYGNGDLALRLNQLKFYLRAVVNAILDHQMHAGHMSDEEALKLLTQRAFQSEAEAVGKIIRSKQNPCQLSTYFVGRMAFYRLRQAIEREQGVQFDLGRYHEAVLDHGTLPVKYLPELVRARLTKPR